MVAKCTISTLCHARQPTRLPRQLSLCPPVFSPQNLSSSIGYFLKPLENGKFRLALRGLGLLSLMLASDILAAPHACAFANGQNASIVIGQPHSTITSELAL
jgi:hypothetical protein